MFLREHNVMTKGAYDSVMTARLKKTKRQIPPANVPTQAKTGLEWATRCCA